jgi:ketosteroid isomerase-like protein
MLIRGVLQGYAAVNRRDFDLARLAYDPDCEYCPEQAAFPDSDAVYYGRDGLFRTFWGLQLESFDDVRLDPMEVLDLENHVLVTTQMSGHGTGSGVPVNQKLFQLFTYRRGLIVRQNDFSDRARALEAAGLSEQDGHADS